MLKALKKEMSGLGFTTNLVKNFAHKCKPSMKPQNIAPSNFSIDPLLEQIETVYSALSFIPFDVERRSELYTIFRFLFEEVTLSLNLMQTNDMIKFINFEILKQHDDLFEFLKKKALKGLKQSGKRNVMSDEIVSESI